MLQVLRHAPQVWSILEIGCGTGHFTRWLRDEGLTAAGVDISATMLAEAQALSSPPLVQGDAVRLPFTDGAFNWIALVTTLEFLGQPQTAVAEALRVARHGLLLGVLNRWSALSIWRRLIGCFRPTIYDAARFYGVRELTCRLQSAAHGRGRIVWITTLYPHW